MFITVIEKNVNCLYSTSISHDHECFYGYIRSRKSLAFQSTRLLLKNCTCGKSNSIPRGVKQLEQRRLILMLPKHKSECDLEPPFQKAYYENEFGSRSIGEPNWRPHVRNALDHPNCQEHSPKGGNGLDWFSSIRCPPQPVEQIKPLQSQSHLKSNEITTPRTPKDTLNQTSIQNTKNRGLEYNQTQDYSKVWEMTLEKSMGQKKKAWDRRNGIKERARGDKSYYVPECEAQFHRQGSTLPSACFGTVKTIPDTFIPLVKLPLRPRIPFHEKEQKIAKAREIHEVHELDLWQPADPLHI